MIIWSCKILLESILSDEEGGKGLSGNLGLWLKSNLVRPLILRILRLFVDLKDISNFQRKFRAEIEVRKIKIAIRNGAKRVLVVYDNSVSPPTYGDYLYIILLARYFIAIDLEVKLIVVDSDFRWDWSSRSSLENQIFLSDQIRIAEIFLKSPIAKIERASWLQCEAEIRILNQDTFVVLRENVKKRVSIYNHGFNIFNRLLSEDKTDLISRVLFSIVEFECIDGIIFPEKPYITWGCRYSKLWDSSRNISDTGFVYLHGKLRERFPNHAIMVVSDDIGCAHYSKIASSNRLECIFSKEFSSTLLGDGALILKSKFFFQLRGGGISVFAQFSKTPYECIQPLVHEVMWSSEKLVSWQLSSQLFVNGVTYTEGLNLKSPSFSGLVQRN